MAALVTAISSRPQSESTARNPVRTEPESATSIVSARAFGGRPMRRAVAWAVRLLISATATRAPSRANARAIAWPMPRPAPVTRATFPFSLMTASRSETLIPLGFLFPRRRPEGYPLRWEKLRPRMWAAITLRMAWTVPPPMVNMRTSRAMRSSGSSRE